MQVVFSWIKGNYKIGDVTRYGDEHTPEKLLKLQISNTLRLGWVPIVATNFPFEFSNVKAIEVPIEKTTSAFETKMPCLAYLIKQGILTDDVFYHDCDVYTLRHHDFPKEVEQVGMVYHSLLPRRKLQGGVLYFRRGAYDIITHLASEIKRNKIQKEESYLTGFYNRNPKLTILNYEWNLFRVAEFDWKYKLASKPIINVHFHSQYKSCYDCFILGKNKYNTKIVTPELLELMVKYGV